MLQFEHCSVWAWITIMFEVIILKSKLNYEKFTLNSKYVNFVDFCLLTQKSTFKVYNTLKQTWVQFSSTETTSNNRLFFSHRKTRNSSFSKVNVCCYSVWVTLPAPPFVYSEKSFLNSVWMFVHIHACIHPRWHIHSSGLAVSLLLYCFLSLCQCGTTPYSISEVKFDYSYYVCSILSRFEVPVEYRYC